MGCSLPGSSVHRILQAKILEWIAIPFSGIQTPIAGGFFSIWAIREAPKNYVFMIYLYNIPFFIDENRTGMVKKNLIPRKYKGRIMICGYMTNEVGGGSGRGGAVCVCMWCSKSCGLTDAELSASLNTVTTIGEPHIGFSQSENFHFGPASPGALVSWHQGSETQNQPLRYRCNDSSTNIHLWKCCFPLYICEFH